MFIITYSHSSVTNFFFNFIAQDFADLTVKVDGKVGILIDFPLPESDMCKLGSTCPIKANVPNKATFTVAVSSHYPSVSRETHACIMSVLLLCWCCWHTDNGTCVCVCWGHQGQGRMLWSRTKACLTPPTSPLGLLLIMVTVSQHRHCTCAHTHMHTLNTKFLVNIAKLCVHKVESTTFSSRLT